MLAFRDFQLLKLKYDNPLSSFAFNFNLRHYTKGRALLVTTHHLDEAERLGSRVAVLHRGGAVQVDPGFLQLTLRLLSALETIM